LAAIYFDNTDATTVRQQDAALHAAQAVCCGEKWILNVLGT
jgi:hypothetical protein